MVIVDHQIRQLCRDMGLVEPFDPDMINPATIDVTLGDTIEVEVESGGVAAFVDISAEPFFMPPGAFVLAHTREYVRVPNNLDCEFRLKSSRAREGYQHGMAVYIDPGFHGQIVLELSNSLRFNELALKAGMRIGQLRFCKLGDIPMRGYAVTGRYHGQTGVQRSKG